MRWLDRLKTGLVLTKDSLVLLKNNPKLAVFPLVSGVAGLAFLALFLGVTFGLMAITPEGGALAGLFLAYVGLTFISTFFVAGLVHQTRAALAGETSSLREGLEAAWSVKGSLLLWAVVAATVGIVINAIENSDSRLARLFGTIFGVAWTLLTFFVVPVIVFERSGGTEMFTESASTFKQTWGETPISLFAVQAIATVIALPLVAMGLLLYATAPIAAVALALVGVALSFLIGQTLQGIIKTTLYLYATSGERPSEFDDVDFGKLAADGDDGRTATPRTTTGGFR